MSGIPLDYEMNNNEKIVDKVRKYALVFMLILISVVFASVSPTFRKLGNLINILRQVSINGILAVGMTLIIITGGIDLSIGPLCAIAGVVAALFLKANPDAVAIAIVLGVVAAAVMSTWTASLVAYTGIAPFIASLSAMSVAKGLVLVIAQGVPHTIRNKSFTSIGNGYLWDPKLTGNISIPIPVIIFIAMILVSSFFLYKTRFGRYIYSVGGNEQASIAAGINTRSVKFWTYVFNGFLCGIAGIVLSARITSGQPMAADGYETDAITAVIVGGTSMSGGIGRIGMTVIGVLILGVMDNGLTILGVSSYYQRILKGVIIAAAVLIDIRTKK
jgi:ribose/xylose/arabinose/galactoside ABC-type transport system permease subunit